MKSHGNSHSGTMECSVYYKYQLLLCSSQNRCLGTRGVREGDVYGNSTLWESFYLVINISKRSIVSDFLRQSHVNLDGAADNEIELQPRICVPVDACLPV
jgi:hypothetical protein